MGQRRVQLATIQGQQHRRHAKAKPRPDGGGDSFSACAAGGLLPSSSSPVTPQTRARRGDKAPRKTLRHPPFLAGPLFPSSRVPLLVLARYRDLQCYHELIPRVRKGDDVLIVATVLILQQLAEAWDTYISTTAGERGGFLEAKAINLEEESLRITD